jgi:hypothetical protein
VLKLPKFFLSEIIVMYSVSAYFLWNTKVFYPEGNEMFLKKYFSAVLEMLKYISL